MKSTVHVGLDMSFKVTVTVDSQGWIKSELVLLDSGK